MLVIVTLFIISMLIFAPSAMAQGQTSFPLTSFLFLDPSTGNTFTRFRVPNIGSRPFPNPVWGQFAIPAGFLGRLSINPSTVGPIGGALNFPN